MQGSSESISQFLFYFLKQMKSYLIGNLADRSPSKVELTKGSQSCKN